ncbi:translesion error-prone DNA polymerase V autoproteolytic subunit [Runella sp. CRIBMP]|uniref:LexA family protein n=1 Tax=Runella sp. CRIBMP TaxID=2683261 RepID=UPI0014130578|nr:translesion error-prone DNA polymerase V autoproteolytic subunit [Runella sp. CRIBMP]NBB23398.1 translesion error-prone DNA polymerase V autoproteolytic subunit [Runella sp. CRIBMP]
MSDRKIPPSKVLEILPIKAISSLEIPFVGDIAAGFPSPAEDYLEECIDLNREFIKNPTSTFYGRVKGVSMIDSGYYPGDVLIIDKSLQPKTNSVVVCYLNGEFTLKRVKIEKKQIYLMPDNAEFQPILVTEDDELIIWGVVTYVIKKSY